MPIVYLSRELFRLDNFLFIISPFKTFNQLLCASPVSVVKVLIGF